MELTCLSQVLFLAFYHIEIGSEHMQYSLGSLFLQILVDRPNSGQFTVFELAKGVNGLKMYL